MWEQLTPTDIAQVRDRLALMRAATVSRHAAELKILDNEQEEVEKFARLVDAFAEKYMNEKKAPSEPETPSEEQPTLAVATDVSEPSTPGAEQDAGFPNPPVEQQVSPNFGTPPRLRRFIGG